MFASQKRARQSCARRSSQSRAALAAASVAILVIALAVSVAALVQAPNASAAPGVSPSDPIAKKFVGAISIGDITQHQTALQQIASLNNDTREVFSTGYQASLDYVVSTLEAAGYDPEINLFNFPFWQESQPAVLNMVSPTAKTYIPGDADDSDLPTADFITMANSPTVELTNAPVFPVGGILDPPTGGSASGCLDTDYTGVSGKVALVQRGTCPFVTKWELAQAAGATGVIIYNEGNTPARQNPIFVDNQPDPPATIAAVISSYTLGNELLQAYKQNLNPTVDFKVYGTFTDRFLPQVLAETSEGDPNHVVVVGAHLDSVPEGPGINDDGSGTATLLAQAEEIADGHYNIRNKIRFAWWGAEELGLVGSTAYVAELSQAERDRIAMYLNYDMVGSPNYVFFVYDGDNSDGVGAGPGPAGSAQIEELYESFYEARGLPYKGTDFSGRSDYGPFIAAGVDIPAGGLFTGAEGIKTAQEASLWGGTAGIQYDPCYHLACDTFANNSNTALGVNSDLIAYAQLTYAFSTESVNGVPGRIVPGSPSTP